MWQVSTWKAKLAAAASPTTPSAENLALDMPGELDEVPCLLL